MRRAVILFIIIILLLVYFGLVFVLPKVLASDFAFSKLNDFLKRYDLNLAKNALELKITPLLKIDIKTDKMELHNLDGESVLNAENLDLRYSLLNKKVERLNSDYIYFAPSKINLKAKKSNGKKKADRDFSFLGSVFVKKAKIDFRDYSVNIDDLKVKDGVLKARIELILDGLKIVIGQKGNLTFLKDNVIFNDLDIKLDNSLIHLTGDLNEFKIRAKSASAAKIEKLALIIMKKKNNNDNKRQFLENFKNFDGILDIDLTYKHKSLEGSIVAPILRAQTTRFSIPIVFKNAKFEFKNNKVISENKGKFGGDDAVLKLNYDNLFSPDLVVFGTVVGVLGEKFNYINDLAVLGSVQIRVDFKTQHKKPEVNYFITLPKNSDIIYKGAYLGLRKEQRYLKVFTNKEKGKLKIDDFSYSFLKNNVEKLILRGSGEFITIKNKLKPSYVVIKTNGSAPFSIAGSFSKFTEGGEFLGDLKYDFIKKQFLGNFYLINIKYKDFVVKNALVSADKEKIKIKANGFYRDSYFAYRLNALNSLHKIKIYETYLFLDEYEICPLRNERKRKASNKGFELDKGVIKLNKLIKNKIKIENILVTGSAKNDVFEFNSKNAQFCKGLLSAKGKYDFNTKTAEVDFSADKIDSNAVAEDFFNLKNQLEGTASAKMKAIISNDFKNINARADFQIDEGSLPKLQEKVFTFKGSKFKLENVINLKESQIKDIKSNIKGSFDIENKTLKNIEIIAKQKVLAFSINGNYDFINQNGLFNIFGKYNKASKKGTKIFFIPIRWIIKILFKSEKTYETYKNYFEKLPQINAQKVEYFRIKLEGNLNENSIKYELKSVR